MQISHKVKTFFIVFYFCLFTQDCHGKSSIQQEHYFFTRKLGLNLRKKLVKCYIWRIAFHSIEAWTLGEWFRNSWKVLKFGAGEG